MARASAWPTPPSRPPPSPAARPAPSVTAAPRTSPDCPIARVCARDKFHGEVAKRHANRQRGVINPWASDFLALIVAAALAVAALVAPVAAGRLAGIAAALHRGRRCRARPGAAARAAHAARAAIVFAALKR